MRALFSLALVLTIAGCVRDPFAIPLRSSLAKEDLFPYAATGERRIVGQALLRMKVGFIVTCAGLDAALLPAVPLVDEAMRIWDKEDEVYTANLEDLNVRGSVRWSTCDAGGNFNFDDLPPEKFWIVAPVVWEAPDIFIDIDDPDDDGGRQGGILARRIDLSKGSELRLILSEDDTNYLKAEPWDLWGKLN